MKKSITHKIFCWKSGTMYYLSLRSVRQPKNSVDTRKYYSAWGRNDMANKIRDSYKGKAEIIRNTNPNKLK